MPLNASAKETINFRKSKWDEFCSTDRLKRIGRTNFSYKTRPARRYTKKCYICGVKKAWYHILALVVVGIWGVTFISTKVLIANGLTPAQIFFARFSVAYLGIWLLCLRSKASRKIYAGRVRDELLLAFLGITGGSLYFLTENTALACTQACSVSFIVCSAPLITLILTLLLKRFLRGDLAAGLEDVKLKPSLMTGTVLALAGMALVLFDGNAVEFSLKGDLLALGAALCWGLYSVFMSQMTTAHGTLMATRKVFFYGLVTILPFIVGDFPPAELFARPQVWGNLLFLSLAASLLCFVLWNKVMAVLGNVTSTNYVYLNPFFTLVGAVLILGETMTPLSAIGSLAIVAGVIIAGR